MWTCCTIIHPPEAIRVSLWFVVVVIVLSFFQYPLFKAKYLFYAAARPVCIYYIFIYVCICARVCGWVGLLQRHFSRHDGLMFIP